ncbi:hypothetical protein AAG570_005277 [Ranatra chinensis]|uniref:C2H2-type domain-containing protein n=1 Tax=Ranatra chinensis TaxID=642074 RepID=A0ABD0XZZ2_9HEMI
MIKHSSSLEIGYWIREKKRICAVGRAGKSHRHRPSQTLPSELQRAARNLHHQQQQQQLIALQQQGCDLSILHKLLVEHEYRAELGMEGGRFLPHFLPAITITPAPAVITQPPPPSRTSLEEAEVIDRLKRLGTVVEVEEQKTQDDVSSKCLKMLEKMARATDVADTPMSPIVMALRDHERPPPPVYVGKEISVSYTSEGGREIMGNANMYAPAMVVCESNLEDVSLLHEEGNLFEPVIDIVEGENHLGPDGTFAFRTSSYVDTSDLSQCYSCDICSAVYQHAHMLRKHYLRLHVARKYISERDMEHYNIDLEPDTEVQGDGARVERLIFRCHTCRRCFSGKTELKSHLTDHPPVSEIRKPSTKQQKQYKCPNCETTFKWRKVYGRHKKTCKPPEKPAPSVDTPSFHCLYCNETFFNANKKKNHVLSLHPYCRKRHACVFCKQDGYPTHSALFGHLISEHADVYFGCEECRERFAQMSELAAHNNEKHNAPLLPKTPAIDQRFYSCSTCDRIYLVESSFSEHYPICLNPPPPKVTPPLPSPTSQEVARRGKSRKGKSGGKAKLEEVDPETLFYSRVSGNIRDNLLHHLDGKLDTIRVLSDSDPANSDARARKLMHFSAGFSSPTSPDGEHNDKEEASPNSAAARAKTPWEKYSFPKNYDGRCGLTSYIKDTSYLDISTQLIMRRNLQRLNMLPIIKEAQPTGASEGEGEEDVPSVLALERLGAQCAESFGEVKRIKNEETETTVLGELSGEWVRDRTYICSVCGWETPCLWSMEDHKYEIHPNVLCPQHELVGDDRDLSKLIYTRLVSAPPLFSPRRGGVTPSGPLPPATEAKCTKCGQSGFKGPSDLHLHIMECAGEDLGIVAGIPGGSQRTSSGRRKWRSTRKRRSGRRGLKRNIPSTPQRPPQKLRTKPGDTDTIQKMIANLPAKRITRRVIGFDEIEIKTRSQATIQNNRLLRKRIMKAPTPNGIQRTVKPNKPKQIKQEQTHTFASSRHLMVSQPLTKKEEPRIDSTRKVTDFIDTSAERGDVLSSLRMMPVKVKKPSVDDSTETESSMVIVSQKSEKEVEKEQDIVQKVAMCTGCGVCFEAKAALKRHHKSCVYYRESRPDNPCKSCNLSFPFLTALLEHNCQKDTGAPPRQMPKLEIEKDLAPVNSSEIPVLSPIAETAVEPPREVITDPKTRGENKPCHTPPPLIPKVPILEIPRPPPVGPILEIPRDSFIGISFIGGKIKYETLSSVSEETEKLEMGGVVFDKELVKKTKSPAKVLQKLSRKQKGLGGQKLQTGRKRKIGHEVGATEGEPKSKKPRVSKKKVVQQGEESANIELSPKKKRKYVRKLSVTPVKQEEEGQVKSSETSPAVETPSTPSVKKRKPGRPFGSVTKKSSGGSPLDLRPKRTRKSCGNGNDEKRRVSGRLGVVQKGNKKNDISLDSDKNTDEVAQSNIIKEDESVVKTDPELKDKTEDRSGDKEMEVNVKDEQEDESQPDENATRVGEDIKVDELKDEPEVGVVSEAEAEVVEERKKRRSRGSPASRRKKDTVKVTASGNQNGTQEVKTEVDPDKEFRQQEVDSPCSKSKSSSSRSNSAGRRSTAVNNVVDGAQVVESMAENDTEKCDEGDVVSLLEVPKNRRRSFRGSPATRRRKDIVKTGVESHLSTISKKEDDSDVVKNDLEEHDSPLERVTTPVLEESKSKRYCSRSASTRLNRKDDGAGSSHLNKVQELENIGEPRNDIVKEGDVELDQKPKNKGCLENSPTNRKRKVDTEYLADTSLEETCYNSTGKDSKNCDETAAELVLEEPKNRWTNRPSRTRRKVVSEEALGDEVRIETEETTVTEPVETPEMLGKTQDDENKALIPEQPKSKKRNSRQSPANNKKRGVLAEGSNVSEVELGGKCPETQTYVIHETNIPPVVIEEPKNRKLCGKQNSPGIRNNDLDGSSLGKAEEEISNTTESMAMTQGESTDKTVVSDGQVEQLSVECEKNPTGDGLLNEYSERGSIIESTVIGPEVDGVKGEVDTSASEKLNVTTCSKEVKSEGVEQAEQDVEMDESKGPDVAIDSQIDETSSRGEERKKKCRKATVKKEMADTSFDIDDGCCSVRTKKRKLEKKCVKPKRKHHLLLLETEFSSSESQSESGGDYTRKLKKLKDPLLGVKRSTNNMILKKKKKLLKLKNKIVTGGDREVIKVGPFKWEVSTFSRFSPKKDSDQCSNCHGNEPRNTGQKDNLCRSDSGSNKNNPATDNTDPSTLESSVPQIFSATPPSATEVGSSCKPSCESLPLKTGSSLGFDRSSDTTAEAPFPSAPSCGGVDLAVPTSCSEDVTYRLPPARSISPIWSQQLWEGNSSETQAQTNVNPSLGTILDSVNKLLSEPESTYTPLMLPQYSLADLQKAMGASDAEMAVLQQLGEASLQARYFDTEESGSGGGNVLIKDEEEWATEGCSIMDLDNQPPQPAQPSSRQDGVSSSTSPPNTTQTPLVSLPPHQFQASATSTGTNSTQHPTSFGNHHPQTIGLSMSSAPSLSFKDEIMASLSMHNSRHRTSPSVSNSNNLLAAHSGKEVVCPTCSCHFMGFPALQVHVNKAHSDIPNSTPVTTLNRRVVLESAKESRLICFVCQQILPSNLMCSHLVVEHSLKSVDITKCTSVTGEMPNSDGSVGGERLKSKMSSALDGLLERAVNNLLSAKKPGSRLELSGGVVQLLTKLCAVRGKDVGGDAATNTSFQNRIRSNSKDIFRKLKLESSCDNSNSSSSSWGSSSAVGTASQTKQYSKSYNCAICGEKFPLASTRNRHVLQAHTKSAVPSEDRYNSELFEYENDWREAPSPPNSFCDSGTELPCEGETRRAVHPLCSDCGLSFRSIHDMTAHRLEYHTKSRRMSTDSVSLVSGSRVNSPVFIPGSRRSSVDAPTGSSHVCTHPHVVEKTPSRKNKICSASRGGGTQGRKRGGGGFSKRKPVGIGRGKPPLNRASTDVEEVKKAMSPPPAQVELPSTSSGQKSPSSATSPAGGKKRPGRPKKVQQAEGPIPPKKKNTPAAAVPSAKQGVSRGICRSERKKVRLTHVGEESVKEKAEAALRELNQPKKGKDGCCARWNNAMTFTRAATGVRPASPTPTPPPQPTDIYDFSEDSTTAAAALAAV